MVGVVPEDGRRRKAGGTYRTREPVALCLQRYATQLEEATKVALQQAPKRQPRNPHEAERRRLTKLLNSAQGKIDRLLDAYTDGAVELPEYKRRRTEIQTEVDHARNRLVELDQAPAREPAAPAVRTFADMWPTLSVEARRDVAGALLTKVQVEGQDRHTRPTLGATSTDHLHEARTCPAHLNGVCDAHVTSVSLAAQTVDFLRQPALPGRDKSTSG